MPSSAFQTIEPYSNTDRCDGAQGIDPEHVGGLARVMMEALAIHYGNRELLRRFAHPFWFESLGHALGCGWHAPDLPSVVLSAVDAGLASVSDELGLHLYTGSGRDIRDTPATLRATGDDKGLDGEALARTCARIVRVDGQLVHDGFQVQIQAFFVTAEGDWVAVHDATHPTLGGRRRYHWCSTWSGDLINAPHAAIEGQRRIKPIVNLTDRRAAPARMRLLEQLRAGPEVVGELMAEAARKCPCPPLGASINTAHLHATLDRVAALAPESLHTALEIPELSAGLLAAIAQANEIVFGCACHFDDPARLSFVHGEDANDPFPVPLDVYATTLEVLRRAVQSARLPHASKQISLRALAQQASALEAVANERTPNSSDAVQGHLPGF